MGLLTDGEHDSLWRWASRLFGGFWMAANAWSMVGWRITADSTGPRVRRRRRSQEVPWEAIRTVVYAGDGLMAVRTHAGIPDAVVGTVGRPWAERQLGLRNRAGRAAAELSAMVRDPALRPPAQG